MFPLKYCGLWFMVYSNNPIFPKQTTMTIEYNRVELSPYKEYGIFQVKRTIQGVIGVKEDHAKILWSKQAMYEIESPLLPTIQLPKKDVICYQTNVKHTMDETNSYLTIEDENHTYIFCRTIPTAQKDTLLKIFMTQLLFDYIIRHLFN
jgi:hypothetical protein